MIRSILLKLTISGSGIVNFDSADQRFLWNRMKSGNVNHENVSFGKANYAIEGEDVVRYPKISADCLRNAMWKYEMPTMLPNVNLDNSQSLATKAIATPALLSRGYMFADFGFRRKSPVAFTAAIADKTVSQIETHSNSSPKDEKIGERSGISFFGRESRGALDYRAHGTIDLVELGFISLSDVHGRISFNPDKTKEFRELLKERLGCDDDIPEPAYYKRKHDVYDLPEFGIQLTQNQIKLLLKDIINKIATINIQRTVTGSARTSELEVKLVSNPVEDLFDGDGWLKVKEIGKKHSLSFLDKLVVDDAYYAVDPFGESKVKTYLAIPPAKKKEK
jgi:hypothetical protein